MRKNLAGIGVLICFAFMLLFPKDVFNGASKGLLLWFHTVFPHTVSLFDHHKPADVHQLHPSDCPPVRPSSEQNLPGLSKRELCDHCRLSLRISYGRQNFRRPDTYKTDFTAGRSVSALLLQQYKSGLYFQFCSLENTGKKRTDDSVHPDPDSCAHSGQLFYEKNVFEGKTGISGSGFRLAEKYVLVL